VNLTESNDWPANEWVVASFELKPANPSGAAEIHPTPFDSTALPPKTYIIAAEPPAAVRKPWRDRRVSPERRA
jgi:hypothetical protein